MAELTLEDARRFNARLEDVDDDALQDMLDAALAAARRFCGWFVTPVQTDVELTVDGPGGRVLSLPTRNLIAISELTEAGVALDVTKLDPSRRTGTVEKHPYGWWTCRNGAIVVKMTHGFTEVEAADWRRGILRLVDIMSLEPVSVGAERESPEMKRKRIDDVDYEWYDKLISTNDQLAALFSQYRILPSP